MSNNYLLKNKHHEIIIKSHNPALSVNDEKIKFNHHFNIGLKGHKLLFYETSGILKMITESIEHHISEGTPYETEFTINDGHRKIRITTKDNKTFFINI